MLPWWAWSWWKKVNIGWKEGDRAPGLLRSGRSLSTPQPAPREASGRLRRAVAIPQVCRPFHRPIKKRGVSKPLARSPRERPLCDIGRGRSTIKRLRAIHCSSRPSAASGGECVRVGGGAIQIDFVAFPSKETRKFPRETSTKNVRDEDSGNTFWQESGRFSAIGGNVGSIISFAVRSEDAEWLVAAMSKNTGDLQPADLINLPRYTAYARLLVDGMPTGPTSLATLPPPNLTDDRYTIVTQASRRRFGRQRNGA